MLLTVVNQCNSTYMRSRNGSRANAVCINVKETGSGISRNPLRIRLDYQTGLSNEMLARTVICEGWKEGNVLFIDALNSFILRLYGVRHMVRYHSDSERGNQLPPHGLLFPIRVLLYASSHRQDNTYHCLFLHQSWSTGWNEK